MAFASIKASAKGGKDFELVPPGVHLAICTKIVHVGYQKAYNPKYPDKNEVWLDFEVPDIRVKWMKDGEEKEGPAIVRRKFSLSLSEKSNLRPFLESWRGKPFTKEEEDGFEITALLGKICQLSIIHEPSADGKKTYANINGAFGIIKEQRDALVANPARGKPSGELLVYSVDAHDQAIYDKLPEWQQKLIDGRVQEKAASAATDQTAAKSAEDYNDDIPF